jgi:ubiquinone/menaquinone biosynthesis C-methylase UbiE
MTKTKISKFKKDLKQVQDHYLNYPYPFRNPEDDKKRIIRTQEGYLSNINHHLYKGNQNFQNEYRVLIAGGGTGDSTIWLAKQLMEYPKSEVVYIDFSEASMNIAKKRANIQGITNIKWILDSILNIPKLKLGKFDYINCSGALQAMKKPDLGIKILSDVLKENGGAALMLYGQYGRVGVYQLQELLRIINKGVTNHQDKVNNTWNVLNNLPTTNWYIRGLDLVGPLVDDIELYDRLLHDQDTAHTIPQLYELTENVGLNIVTFVVPYVRASLNIDSYFKESALKEKIKKMSLRDQQSICELMGGNIIMHEIYVSKQQNTVADFNNFNNVPFVFNIKGNLCQNIISLIEKGGLNIMNKFINYQIFSENKFEVNINLTILPHTKCLFSHLENGNKSFIEIFDDVRKETGSTSSNQELLDEFVINLKPLYSAGVILLRHKSVKSFNNFDELSK